MLYRSLWVAAGVTAGAVFAFGGPAAAIGRGMPAPKGAVVGVPARGPMTAPSYVVLVPIRPRTGMQLPPGVQLAVPARPAMRPPTHAPRAVPPRKHM